MRKIKSFAPLLKKKKKRTEFLDLNRGKKGNKEGA